jgi:hypothetical protein
LKRVVRGDGAPDEPAGGRVGEVLEHEEIREVDRGGGRLVDAQGGQVGVASVHGLPGGFPDRLCGRGGRFGAGGIGRIGAAGKDQE